MKTQRAGLALPIVLPLINCETGKPLINAYRLIYANAVIVYYSFQHPIGFLSGKQFVARVDYWTRRRTDRAFHIKCAIADKPFAFALSDTNTFTSTLLDDEAFFDRLQEELEKYGIGTISKKTGVSDCKPGKRRVVL